MCDISADFINKNDLDIGNLRLLNLRTLYNKCKEINWKILHNALPTAENLWKAYGRTFRHTIYCKVCRKMETQEHIFIECSFARKILKEIVKYYGIDEDLMKVHIDPNFQKNINVREALIISAVRKEIWTIRCAKIFRDISKPEQVADTIKRKLKNNTLQSIIQRKNQTV